MELSQLYLDLIDPNPSKFESLHQSIHLHLSGASMQNRVDPIVLSVGYRNHHVSHAQILRLAAHAKDRAHHLSGNCHAESQRAQLPLSQHCGAGQYFFHDAILAPSGWHHERHANQA